MKSRMGNVSAGNQYKRRIYGDADSGFFRTSCLGGSRRGCKVRMVFLLYGKRPCTQTIGNVTKTRKTTNPLPKDTALHPICSLNLVRPPSRGSGRTLLKAPSKASNRNNTPIGTPQPGNVHVKSIAPGSGNVPAKPTSHSGKVPAQPSAPSSNVHAKPSPQSANVPAKPAAHSGNVHAKPKAPSANVSSKANAASGSPPPYIAS